MRNLRGRVSGASVQFIALKTETPKVVKGAPLTLRLRFARSIRTAGKRREGFQGFSARIYRIIMIMKTPNTAAHCEIL